MRRFSRSYSSLLFAVVAILTGSQLAFAADEASDESVLSEKLIAFEQSLNAKEVEKVLSHFTGDARFTAQGKKSDGAKMLRDRFADEFNAHPKRKWKFESQGIRFTTKDVALVDVACTITDSNETPSKGRGLLVHVRSDGRWRINELRLADVWKKQSEKKYLPLVAAPVQHKQVFENEYVRVFRVTNPPGGVAPNHVHIWPSVVIMDQPADLVVRNERGIVIGERKDAPPSISFDGPSKSPYSVQNVDDHPIRLWRIELKTLVRPKEESKKR
jgi:uncharacterized protein (TIGR02246 family)